MSLKRSTVDLLFLFILSFFTVWSVTILFLVGFSIKRGNLLIWFFYKEKLDECKEIGPFEPNLILLADSSREIIIEWLISGWKILFFSFTIVKLCFIFFLLFIYNDFYGETLRLLEIYLILIFLLFGSKTEIEGLHSITFSFYWSNLFWLCTLPSLMDLFLNCFKDYFFIVVYGLLFYWICERLWMKGC